MMRTMMTSSPISLEETAYAIAALYQSIPSPDLDALGLTPTDVLTPEQALEALEKLEPCTHPISEGMPVCSKCAREVLTLAAGRNMARLTGVSEARIEELCWMLIEAWR